MHVIKRGLDLPISGAPEQTVHDGAPVKRVAVLNDEYPFMKPRMHVAEGDVVKRGQLLFEDRKSAGVRFTAPGAGTVVAVNRGARRKLESVVIELNEREQAGRPADEDFQPFQAYTAGRSVDQLDPAAVKALLAESGLWTALRARPFDRVPSTQESPAAVFVTAIDTRPGAPDPVKVLEGKGEAFTAGLYAVSKLTEGDVWLCKAKGAAIGNQGNVPRVKVAEFAGKHPAGLVGTHIHLLAPVSRSKVVWHLGYQDVLAIGELFATGKLSVQRVVALAGPQAKQPRLLRTRLGAEVAPLVDGGLKDGETRLVSGSILHGHTAAGPVGFLDRYTNQITAVREGREREFLGWLVPGLKKYSTVRAFASGLLGLFGPGKKTLDFTTTTNGSHRAMVPIGMFEKVMPLDIMPTFLLRALLVDDLERAEKLGALELGEEDLALCTFVSPGKEDYGVALRRNLTTIWKEG
ncbi:MAG: Na(+)-translocating NADH-quinone reductase subunit A [Myxococcales bacterium]|nr:Na(+)-translocating NADH-quinone reductase subunit A [Myxococcales bacterium]